MEASIVTEKQEREAVAGKRHKSARGGYSSCRRLPSVPDKLPSWRWRGRRKMLPAKSQPNSANAAGQRPFKRRGCEKSCAEASFLALLATKECDWERGLNRNYEAGAASGTYRAERSEPLWNSPRETGDGAA